ncbi:MAG TPA: deoxyribodipyrimidine photo-lyase [Steroidobacteraceae bacterium]|nr:deoxyribodipyrimidine photo-lyase [Steroidobacteraceae bacterium]
MSENPCAVVWFRRDLRLADNPALNAACAASRRVVALYVHDPQAEGEWAPGAASNWWLHHSLERLAAGLRARGSRLLIRRGPALPALHEVARECGATVVYWNRLYEPAIRERDTRVKSALRETGLQAESFNAALWFEPWEIRTGQGGPYRVFTPFWRTCEAQLDAQPPPQPAPSRIPPPPPRMAGLELEELSLLPRVRWDDGLRTHWRPGEDGALERLAGFCEEALATYTVGRNRPDQPASSRLSPHLHFGEVSPRQCLAAVRNALIGHAGAGPSAASFLRELGWREFAHHLLHHYPATAVAPLDARFERFPWEPNTRRLEAWQRGRSGYPLVDAGMRELWATGWMHNRVRMITASLLTKNLRQHWLEGARWFWDTLVDADLASNTLGWQWTAGCGADAAPYFRIFNPVLQSVRYDPQGAYLRRWLPELRRLPDRHLPQPWTAPASVLEAAGVRLGEDYPEPIVAFAASREAALRGYAVIKSPGPAAIG